MLHIEWNWLLIMFIGYFFAGLTLGTFAERDAHKTHHALDEEEIVNLYREIDRLHEIIYDLDHQTPAKPIRQARG